MKNLRKKLLIIVLLMITLFSLSTNYIFAATQISSAKIQSGVDCGLHLQYKAPSGTWYYVTTHYQYYSYNGKEYPAYCVNPDRDGATEAGSYTVNIDSVMSDLRIWRVVINGYPYKTPAQMGVETWQDAYVATKQAVYSILYNRDVDSYYRGGDARGTKIAKAIDKMVTEGRSGTKKPQSANLSIAKVGQFTEEGGYYSQTYKVSSAVDIESYTIKDTLNMPSGGIVANMSNVEQTSFKGGEQFKVLIPKDKLLKDISTTIKIEASCETYSVFYGESGKSSLQNYALAFLPYTTENANTTLDIAGDNAVLKIKKIDSETRKSNEGSKI